MPLPRVLRSIPYRGYELWEVELGEPPQIEWRVMRGTEHDATGTSEADAKVHVDELIQDQAFFEKTNKFPTT
jgi:hypothetical protein